MPSTIDVHPKFGDSRQFLVDGFLGEQLSPTNPPTFSIVDNLGRQVFKVKLNPDPNIQSITCTSELNSVKQFIFKIDVP